MTTEWKEITNPEELFRLKREGWEIEFQTASGGWISWSAQDWSFRWTFRARPRQPKMKKVKLFAYLDHSGEIRFVDYTPARNDWTRQPHLDLEGSIPE